MTMEFPDLHIAYRRFGAGPDVVLILPLLTNVELGWEQKIFRRALEHLGRYLRVLQLRDLLLGGDRSFADRGEHALEGVAGAWRPYEPAS